MSQNKFTTNNNPTIVAVSNADGETPVYLYADPVTHGLVISGTINVAADGAMLDGVSSSIRATVFDLTNSNPQSVAIVDANGDQISSFGGGTQYTEDAAAAANPVGTALNLIRADTPATITSTDGDNVAQRGTNYGAAYTQIVTSGGAFVDTFGGGTQYTDGDADATPTGTVALGFDGANVRALTTDAAGDLQVDVASSALPSGAATSALQTTGNTSLGIIAGAVSGTEMQVDVLTMPTTTVQATDLDIRNLVFATDKVDVSGSTLAANSGVDIGDVTVNNAAGASAVNIQDGGNSITVDGTVGLSAGTNNIGDVDIASIAAGDNNIGNVDIVTMPNVTLAAGTNTNEVVGDVAEDVALAGNPVRTGVRASQAEPTAMSADGDVVTPWADRRGRTVVTKQVATGTQTSVAGSTSSVTLLASNTSRKGFSIYNDSTAILYIRFQATATTSNFSVKLQPDAYYEDAIGYTGIVDGIWASATGNARVTEYS